jgi:hypothetical protein
MLASGKRALSSSSSAATGSHLLSCQLPDAEVRSEPSVSRWVTGGWEMNVYEEWTEVGTPR